MQLISQGFSDVEMIRTSHFRVMNTEGFQLIPPNWIYYVKPGFTVEIRAKTSTTTGPLQVPCHNDISSQISSNTASGGAFQRLSMSGNTDRFARKLFEGPVLIGQSTMLLDFFKNMADSKEDDRIKKHDHTEEDNHTKEDGLNFEPQFVAHDDESSDTEEDDDDDEHVIDIDAAQAMAKLSLADLLGRWTNVAAAPSHDGGDDSAATVPAPL